MVQIEQCIDLANQDLPESWVVASSHSKLEDALEQLQRFQDDGKVVRLKA